MKIKKIGHSCFIIEEGSTRVLFDPGNTTNTQTNEKNIDAILITHSHGDHLDLESLPEIMSHNKSAKIISSGEVKKLLKEVSIDCQEIKHGESIQIKDINIRAIDVPHAFIYETAPIVKNFGFF